MAIITPTLQLLIADRARKWSWLGAIAEIVDNSFDAGADRVVIEMHRASPSWYSVTDDGVGANDIMHMIQYGMSSAHPTTSLGQFGCGLKDAWVWTANHINITTRRGAKTSNICMGFSDFKMIDGRWECPDPIKSSQPGSPGTSIILSDLAKRLPRRGELGALGLTFLPALRSARQIIIKDGRSKRILPYTMPEYINPVEESFKVDGKRVSIRIGITKECSSPAWTGFLVIYGHRVIRETTIGTGRYNTIRISGEIILNKDDWTITRNKDDYTDHGGALGDAILGYIEPLLREAETISEQFASSELQASVQALLDKAIGNTKKKEARGPPENQTGAIQPKWTHRRRTKATNVHEDQEGSVEKKGKKKRKRSAVDFKWGTLDPDHIGRCDTEAKHVILNVNNPYMKALRDSGNLYGIYIVVASLIAESDIYGESQQKLMRFRQASFSASVGLLVKDFDVKEKKSNGS